MYSFNNGQILRTPWYWKQKPYVIKCSICELDDKLTTFSDRAEEWAHHWVHIAQNKREMYLRTNQEA
jgi:hypothetical protein